jgi:hypothetical protein
MSRSSWVKTATTPGRALAAEVSIERDVVDVGGAARDQARILLAAQRAADVAVAGGRRRLGRAHADTP